ncbi:MAG: DNA helicase PcrA [Clostridia bacterium]|nr:DNA helicase PcrA [Clostridia bacterium]
MSIQDKLNSLNDMQRQAVLTTEGPLLLLAGAGSGKTRVLTHRIAYLIEQGVRPFNILAITFTNKAAREMKERVSAITPQGDEVWVSTFHSTCVRILRREIDKIGYSSKFSIYDADDSERLIKDILKEHNISDKVYPVKMIMSVIGGQKDQMLGPVDYMKSVEKDFRMRKVADVYAIYQERLKENNALDFDDLIFKTVELFRKRPDILDKYRERFKYIMVDEYQDTNGSQYQLVKLLASKYNNLCVVGDDDQSIYGWRGADIKNILDFEKDFNNTVVIKLEQNYRSTGLILESANAVIKNNRTRKAKALWTEAGEGAKLKFHNASGDREEAKYICDTIDKGIMEGKKYSDFAVLYRNNALSRIIEEQLVKTGIPYRLFGGTRFYDRREIRDIMCYLKVLNNPNDDIAIKRIINVPKRSIGDTTVAKVAEYAAENHLSFYMALCGCENIDSLSSRAKTSLQKFISLLNDFSIDAEELSVPDLIEKIIDETGYKAELEAVNTDESLGRLENIVELVNKAAEFEENNEGAELAQFLEEVALVADVDGFTEGDDTAVLMTLHSSKGLEFDTVFIAGFEESIFPGFRAMQDGTGMEMEEERRLCYVGITRAKKELYLTAAKNRLQHGQRVYNMPSRFLKEIPSKFIERTEDGLTVRKADTGFGFEKPLHFNNPAKRPLNPYKMPEPKNVSLDFTVGDKVRHIKFGIGEVIDMTPAGADYEITVDFKNVGTKKLMSKFANLKKI